MWWPNNFVHACTSSGHVRYYSIGCVELSLQTSHTHDATFIYHARARYLVHLQVSFVASFSDISGY